VLDFGYLEADGLHWPVPRGATVDGASIPQALWSILGGPFEGKYRDASVVHDYYCAVRSADWQAVHRMFYRAMLVSGVSAPRAKLLYAAVYFAGPRWDDMVVENVRLGPPAVPTKAARDDLMFSIALDRTKIGITNTIERDGKTAYDWIKSGNLSADNNPEITLELDKLAAIIQRDDPTLREIEAAIDGAVGVIRDAEESPLGVSVGLLKPE
jgi:YD repeat-containing protein